MKKNKISFLVNGKNSTLHSFTNNLSNRIEQIAKEKVEKFKKDQEEKEEQSDNPKLDHQEGTDDDSVA